MNFKNCKILKLFQINAIVLYPFVLYCDANPSKVIISHEQIHLNQIKRDGVFIFYLRYITDYLKGRRQGLNHYQAYRNIQYEKEAFEVKYSTCNLTIFQKNTKY